MRDGDVRAVKMEAKLAFQRWGLSVSGKMEKRDVYFTSSSKIVEKKYHDFITKYVCYSHYNGTRPKYQCKTDIGIGKTIVYKMCYEKKSHFQCNQTALYDKALDAIQVV